MSTFFCIHSVLLNSYFCSCESEHVFLYSFDVSVTEHRLLHSCANDHVFLYSFGVSGHVLLYKCSNEHIFLYSFGVTEYKLMVSYLFIRRRCLVFIQLTCTELIPSQEFTNLPVIHYPYYLLTLTWFPTSGYVIINTDKIRICGRLIHFFLLSLNKSPFLNT